MADPLRIATFNTELKRDGPGLLLRDARTGSAPDVEEAAARIAAARPDIIVLQGIDFDHAQAALRAFAARVAHHGHSLPHVFSLRPNTGIRTDTDLDGDGYDRGPRDAQGYGVFSGQGGLAVLSRYPVTRHESYSAFLWRDLPGALISPNDPGYTLQRLSSTAHWVVEVDAPTTPLTLLTYHATPPVFDGPEDRNGRRNHDESAFWLAYLAGTVGTGPPTGAFVLLGDANLDPEDGDGRPAALSALLNHSMLQDPRPASAIAAELARADGGANRAHTGAPELDTANWRDDPGPGNLRVDYILPSVDWEIAASGVLWAEDSNPEDRISRHGLVWVDLIAPTTR